MSENEDYLNINSENSNQNSVFQVISPNQNYSSPNSPRNKEITIQKIKNLLSNLHKALKYNKSLQKIALNKYSNAQNKMKEIESVIEKINIINKSKPKKHMKYPNYIPLESFYFYTNKRTHLYYHLLEKVLESGKKDSDKEEYSALSINKSNLNRYNFSKQQDNQLNKFLLTNEKNKTINWCKVSADMNNFFGINSNNIAEINENKEINENNNNENNNIENINNCNTVQEKTHKKSSRKTKKLKKIQFFTPLICYIRYLETSNFYKYKKWNKEEDQILRRAILYYGPKNWQQISYCLDGRNNSQCFHRWMKGINPKIRRDKWSFSEDLVLGVSLIKIYGNKKWSKIANHLPGRTDIQCRERWCNILDPSLEEVEWTNEEDLKLLNLNKIYGNKWSLIAKQYGNRTDNTCWRRWKYLTCLNMNSKINNVNGISYNNNDNEKTENDVGDKKGIEKKTLFKVIKFEDK